MKKNGLFLLLLIGLSTGTVLAQSAMRGLHGDIMNDAMGLHAGNKFHITFFNDGTYGDVASGPTSVVQGTWPDDFYGLRHLYLLDGNVFICSEVLDSKGQLRHIHSTNRSAMDGFNNANAWASGDQDPLSGEWWTFLPLPGFHNPDTTRIAMSKWRDSWPPAGWPDKSDDVVDPWWKGKWNGYFGKDVFNADEESYFVADDWKNREFPDFIPDTTDLTRKGLGIRMYCRGFQWANALVDDALFILFDFENIGTYNHDKVVFGYKIGNNMGDYRGVWGGADDGGAFDLSTGLAWQEDSDNKAPGGAAEWPNGVGYIGAAFLESPGNPRDGIDNDGDGRYGSGKTITEDLWAPRVLRKGDKIVLIDYTTFERYVKTFGVETLEGAGKHPKLTLDTVYVRYQDQTYKRAEGDTLKEFQANLIDDNLNGIIDESNGYTYGKPPNQVKNYLFVGLKYKDYIAGEGLDNPMIDERRDDGIDNDQDWNPLTDDLGQDGVPFTNDPGEKDGRPTPGEPHFDKTDIHETDMIGLTSFSLYKYEGFGQYNDEGVWLKLIPGNLDDSMQNDNVENMWGSGYFPMPPKEIQRFSMGIILGFTMEELRENHRWISKAYTENYNFTKAPNIPTVQAFVGDRRVTLVWDDFAEKSNDPITGMDFEGYRIYRSTDPGFTDATPITDGKGNVKFRKPIAQFDMKNGVKGYAQVSMPGMGVQFYLGDDTGLQHSWVDTTAQNGFTYYYAVTAYDRGDQMTTAQILQYQKEHGGLNPNPPYIPPSECSKSIIIVPGQDLPELGANVVRVRPEAPSAGYVPARVDSIKLLVRSETDSTAKSTATGTVTYKVVNSDLLPDGHRFRITFEDSIARNISIPGTSTTVSVSPVTKNYTLVDVTSGDTLLKKCRSFRPDTSDVQTTARGLEIIIYNERALILNSKTSGWSRPGIFSYTFTPYQFSNLEGKPEAADYRIEFGKAGSMGTSTAIKYKSKNLPEIPVNFKVYKLYPSEKGEVREESKFGFYSRDGSAPDSTFSGFSKRLYSDEIVTLNSKLEPGFVFVMTATKADTAVFDNPTEGDYILLRLRKPFLRHDVVEFLTRQAYIDEAKAKVDMNRILVVPNPYVVSNSWEPPNLYTSGRGPRLIHFTHLPMQCTIKIFNIRGQLIRTLAHQSSANDGTEVWDLRTMDQLDIAYGVYIYYVDAGKLGTKVGKFAVIK